MLFHKSIVVIMYWFTGLLFYITSTVQADNTKKIFKNDFCSCGH